MTKNQIQLLRKIIKEHMNIIMQLTAGDNGDGKKPSPALLKKLGLPKGVTDLISDSYKYGKLVTISGKPLEKLPEKEVSKLMKDLKLTSAEKRAIEYSQLNAQNYIDKLQSNVNSSVFSAAIHDQTTMYNTIQQVIPEAIQSGEPMYKVVRQLREMSKDWERDWNRVAMTELWDAKCHGEAQAILHNESPLSSKGAETRVFKRPAPNACNTCKKLYLEPGTNKPKVFTLAELIANGTNYGLKAAQWKPTLGTVHPNCQCTLSILPDGYHLDNNGAMIPD